MSATELLHDPEDPLAVATPEGVRGPVVAKSPLQLFWGRFREDRVALVSLAFVAFLTLVAILAPVVTALVGVPGPLEQDTDALDIFGTATGPSAQNPLGVDRLGRDILARILYGARVSLEVAVISTGICIVVGTVVGLLAGYFRGTADWVLSRIMDVTLAFPILLLGLGFAAACSGAEGCLGGIIQPGLPVVIAVIAGYNWVYIARIVRGQVFSLREREFVDASRSLGASNGRIMFREVLPNLLAPLIVYGSLLIPQNILLEAALSFLGVGVQGGTPSWWSMIADAIGLFPEAWWYMLFPGLALLLTVLAFHLVGDGLQAALNPRGRR